ncbi:MAG: Gfo/Idh/MocA family oxidoreductase [Verrucomicrobia bacterium]|nr:Gfo/Idh/MocA family oxidoreductase [Verrucomicrobiota bacterium]
MVKHSTPPSAGGDSRRDFIRKTASAAALVASGSLFKTPVYGQATAPSAGRVIGANDRIVLGFIGLGGQGLNSHLKPIVSSAQQHNVAVAAVCDVSKTRCDEAKAAAGAGAKAYEDYRRVLEQKDIDAIFCATVDHWHAPISIESMNAGKHVYVEKPLTRYLGEAFDIYDTVKKTGKVLQVGSQGCSDMKWHKAAELIREDAIGPVVMCQGSYMRNTPKGEWNYAIQPWATPTDINWKLWLGNRIKKQKDFSVDDYFRWRKYYQYCAGLLGDLFPHKLHPYMLATGNPEFPNRVAAVGTRKVHTDKNTPGTPERDVPEIIQLIAEFPSGMVMHITCSTVNEVGTQEMIRGHKASLYMAGNKVELKPERPFSDEIDPYTSEAFEPENIPSHQKNFFASIRGTEKPRANIDLAVRVQAVISLAEMSDRLSTMCLFDEKTRKIVDTSGKSLEPITYGSLDIS